jgi:hypothetical protein
MRFIDRIFATFAMFPVIVFITFPIFQAIYVSGFNNKSFPGSVNTANTITAMTAVTGLCYY